jgi:hypothetical protein
MPIIGRVSAGNKPPPLVGYCNIVPLQLSVRSLQNEQHRCRCGHFYKLERTISYSLPGDEIQGGLRHRAERAGRRCASANLFDQEKPMQMKRRTFVRSAIATAMAAALPAEHLWAAGANAATKIAGDINAVTGNGDSKTIEKAVLKELQAGLRGHILLPSSEGYDAARMGWNGMINKHPALIVRCVDASDVTQAVNLAREYGLLTAVRGGGHSAAGKSVCEGGIMIDLSQMKGVRVDPAARSAWIQPGVLLGAVDQETQAHGLAVPAGVVSHTGAAGLTLGGGFGKLSRRYGLTVDNTRYFDVVTADGEFKRANVSENADLFWGLRGGGGNFGVVTQFEYQLHPVGTDFLAGSVMHSIKNAREVYEYFAEFQAKAPKDLQVSASTISFPNGKGFVNISCFYGGDPAEGEKLIAPLLAFGKPMRDDFGIKKYVDIQKQVDRNVPHGQQYYQKAGFIEDVQPEIIEALLEMIANPKPFTQTLNFTQVGGAISEIETSATAYANRAAKLQIVVGGGWPEPVPEAEEWIAALRADWKKIYPYTQGFYINNMMGDEGDKNIRANFGPNYARLVELKNKYDPTNLFSLNANVKPTV